MMNLTETVTVQAMRKNSQSPHAALHGSRTHNPASVINGRSAVASRQNDKIWQACLKFESLFFQQMLSAMRKTVPSSDFLPKGFAENIQGSMLDQAVAQAASQQGTLGIATSLYRQLSRSDGIQAEHDLTDRQFIRHNEGVKHDSYRRP